MRVEQQSLSEKQPAWLVAAIKKTIASLPGGYAEAAEWLGVTQNAVFNRLRTDGDQVFPMGWVMVLEKASGKTHVTDAWSRERDNGYHVPGVDTEVENEDISSKLVELVGRLGDLVNAYQMYIADDVITSQEWQSLKDIAYSFKVTLMQFLNLVSMVYCEAGKGDAQRLQPLGVGANKSCVEK
ncbi:YmfL family putative regulatory protein [Serratia fonticola]|uniref:YmfL family putative regulatory protein n=1 Tax=Serratia fonticola TaxID=47917 RepID=UPI003AB0B1B7